MTITDAEIPAHAENSPSSAEGWTNCLDYINANRGLPDNQTWEAAEGTAAHNISEQCFENGEFAENFVGYTQQVGQWSFTWTEDDAMLLQPGIDWIRSLGGQFYGEHRVDITETVGHDSLGRRQYGTLDRGVITPEMIVVSDLKWGRGVPVYAENCKQIAIYAVNFWRNIARNETKATQFLLHIDQPRHAGGGGKWFVTLDELLKLEEWIRERAKAGRQPNPPRTATPSGCMWCRRKTAPGGCVEHDRYLLDILMVGLDDLDLGILTMPEILTPERREVLIRHSPMIVKYLEQIEAQALEDALAGRPVGRMKAVDGRKSNDMWHNEQVAAATVKAVLGPKATTSKLVTPTQALKQIPPDDFDRLLVEPLVKRGERKPILVPEEDERPARITGKEIDALEDLQPETGD